MVLEMHQNTVRVLADILASYGLRRESATLNELPNILWSTEMQPGHRKAWGVSSMHREVLV